LLKREGHLLILTSSSPPQPSYQKNAKFCAASEAFSLIKMLGEKKKGAHDFLPLSLLHFPAVKVVAHLAGAEFILLPTSFATIFMGNLHGAEKIAACGVVQNSFLLNLSEPAPDASLTKEL